jgi:hypothetical protein
MTSGKGGGNHFASAQVMSMKLESEGDGLDILSK